MQRLDVAMAVVGLLVVAAGVGGSFAFGVEETLEPDQAQAAGAVDGIVTVASKKASIPGPSAPTGGETRADIPVEVTFENLRNLTFLVEIRAPQAVAGNSEFTCHVLDAADNRHDCGATLEFGPTTNGGRVGDLSLTVDLANATEDAIQGTWTVVLEGSTSGPASGDFPATVSVEGMVAPARG